jgi:hypothetical protein
MAEDYPADRHAFADGRTDYEKLVELLGFPESTHLEFKRELDLDLTSAKLNFAKDVVAMSNTPPGGYILVGVDNSGQACIPIGTIDRPRFDPARLGDAVRRYVDGRVDLLVAIHEHLACEIVLIFVRPHADGLPMPMSKVGNYPDPNSPNKSISVFREGDIPVREGAANVPLRHTHWSLILSNFAGQIRDQATETAQALLREFLAERNLSRAESTTAVPDIPLLADMDEVGFASAAQALFEAGGPADIRLRRFLRTIAKRLAPQADRDQFENALDKWTIYCAQAIYAERADLAEDAITLLREGYGEFGLTGEDSRRRLDVVVRIYAVGSMAVRQRAWQVVHSLALQPVPSNPYDSRYIYSSWIRHGQVDGSRSNLIPDDRGGYLISAPRDLLIDHPTMRPDVDDTEISTPDTGGAIAANDTLLNSLCQFDVAYCLIVAAEGVHNGGYYPSAIALKDFRAAPMAERIVSNRETRDALLPGTSDAKLAAVLNDVYAFAERESARYGMFWDTPYSVGAFIRDHHAPDG